MELGTKRKLCLYLDVWFQNLRNEGQQLDPVNFVKLAPNCDADVVISNKTKIQFKFIFLNFLKWNHSSHPVFFSLIMCVTGCVCRRVCVCVGGHKMYWLGRVPFLVEATQPSFFIPISPPMPPNTRIPFFPFRVGTAHTHIHSGGW